MSHPVYLPSATIHPGNLSLQGNTSDVPDDSDNDSSSSSGLDDEAYAKRVAEDIGLGRPTDAERMASSNVLLDPQPNPNVEKVLRTVIPTRLRERLSKLNQGERFHAIGLYAPTSSASQSSAYPLSGPSINPPPAPPERGSISSNRDWNQHQAFRHFALPSEPPMASVPDAGMLIEGAIRADELVAMSIEEHRDLAESVRSTALGGGMPDSRLMRSGHSTLLGNSTSTAH